MINRHFCKKPLWECTQELAAVAQGRTPADVVITNARLVNVYVLVTGMCLYPALGFMGL